MDEAAKYIGNKTGAVGVKNKQEVQTAIVRISKGNYGYLTVGWGPKGSKIINASDLYDEYVKQGYTITAWFHGHFDNQPNFSSTDFENAWHPDKKVVRRKTYLVNRKLEVRVLNNLHLHKAMKKLKRTRKGNVGFSDLQLYYEKKGLPGDKL